MHGGRLKAWMGIKTPDLRLLDFYHAIAPGDQGRVALLLEKFLESCCSLSYQNLFEVRFRLTFRLQHHTGQYYPVLLSLAFSTFHGSCSHILKGIIQDLRILLPPCDVRHRASGPTAYVNRLEFLVEHSTEAPYTKSERKVIDLLMNGLSNKQISDQLHIGIPTVKTHLGNIYRKSGCKGRAAFIALKAGREMK